MIRVNNINKSFDGVAVLKNVSTVFNQGITNLIIGPSGSGKTVLLKSVLGLYEIDSGEIWYDDRNLVTMREKERKKMRQELGMVFQGGALFDSLTVAANVKFPLDMFTGMSPAEKQNALNFVWSMLISNRLPTSYFPVRLVAECKKGLPLHGQLP